MPKDRDDENVLNAISFLFPSGETYFIHSVKYYLDRIEDPVLKDQAKHFVYQEAMQKQVHCSRPADHRITIL